MDPSTRPHVLVASAREYREYLEEYLEAEKIQFKSLAPPWCPEGLAGEIVVSAELPLWFYEHTAAVLEPAFAPGLPPSPSVGQLKRAARGAAYFTVDPLPPDEAARAQATCSALVGTGPERAWFARKLRIREGPRQRLGIRHPAIRRFSPRARELRGLRAAGVCTLLAASTAGSVTVATPSGMRTFCVRRFDASR